MIRKMKAVTVLVCLSVLLASCGSRKSQGAALVNESLNSRTIVKNHYNNVPKFKTLRARLKVDYSDQEEGNQSFAASIRIKKDQTIWIASTLSLVKVLITPQRVSFYNKLDQSYFDGDFSYISDLLGTELNYQMIENLILGNALVDLKAREFKSGFQDNKYELKPSGTNEIYKLLLLLEPENFRMATQQLSQPLTGRVLQIDYSDYTNIQGDMIPSEIRVEAKESGKSTRIALEFKNIELNNDLTFPYSVPGGFKPVEIK